MELQTKFDNERRLKQGAHEEKRKALQSSTYQKNLAAQRLKDKQARGIHRRGPRPHRHLRIRPNQINARIE